MEGYKHYIRVDENNVVVYGFSDAHEAPAAGDILLREDGGRFFEAIAGDADSGRVRDDGGVYLYALDLGGVVKRRAPEEIAADRRAVELEAANRPAPPPVADLLAEIATLKEENTNMQIALVEVYETVLLGGG